MKRLPIKSQSLAFSKIIFLPLLIISTVGILFSSCDKNSLFQNNNAPKSTNDKLSTKNGSLAIQTFIINGFDYNLVGEAHNDYLSYLRENPNFFNMSSEDLYNYGLSYEDVYFTGGIPLTYEEMETAIDETTNLYENLMDNGDLPGGTLVQDSLITEEMQPYVDQLAQIFLDAADTISHAPYTPSEFIQQVNNLEQQIVSNFNPQVDMTDTSANDGSALLCMCSIARYSYSYWYNNYDEWSESHSSEQVIASAGRPGFFVRAWRSIKVAAVDVGGFFGEGHGGASGSGSINGDGSNGHVSGEGHWTGSISDGVKNARAASSFERSKYDD